MSESSEDTLIATEEFRVVENKEVVYRGEKFISHEVPINPNNRATYVVPVYREFGEGNIVNLLETLSEQNISKDEFEAVLLVNNKKSDVDPQSLGYKDNQLTLRVLEAVQKGAELPSEIGDEDRHRLQKVINSGLRINYVDMSTKGIGEVVIGDIRNVGSGIVFRRSEKTEAKDEGVVFGFDADTIVDSEHTTTVLAEIDLGADTVVTNWEWKIPEDALDRLFADRNYVTFLDAYAVTKRAIKGLGFVVGSPRLACRMEGVKRRWGLSRGWIG